VNSSIESERTIRGEETEPTVKVTEIVRGLLLATADAIETVAVYVPAAKDPVVGCNVTTAGAVVVLRDAISHPEPEE
jgi:hypothetical protein